jgi:hypothetical protein
MPFVTEYFGFYPDENGPFGVLMVEHPVRGRVTTVVPAEELRQLLGALPWPESLIVGNDGEAEPLWIDDYPWNWGPNRRMFFSLGAGENWHWKPPE